MVNNLRRLVYRVGTVAFLTLCLKPLSLAEPTDFHIRGIKGLWWDGIGNYQKALPWVASHNLNFLMLCYSSFPASGSDWRSDYPATEKAQIAALAKQAVLKNVRLCLSFNPGIWSKPPLQYSSESDYALALGKVKGMSQLGIKWFALCLDDINKELTPGDRERFGTLQECQVYFVNRLWSDMKAIDPGLKLIFCPSAYTTRDARDHLDYIKRIGDGIDPGVMMFWTGPTVCSTSITAQDARDFATWIKRKPFIWDNYPVNDMYPWRPLMGPLKGRANDLGREVSGYLANPMKQWHLSRIPLATTADYLCRPAAYNPTESIDKAIDAYPKADRQALRLLVQLYGDSFWGDPDFPPMPRVNSADDAKTLLDSYQRLKNLLSKNANLASVYAELLPTLAQDIKLLQRKAGIRLTHTPLKALGDDFAGGAADLYGTQKYEKAVNYVYAVSTGKNVMSADFQVAHAGKFWTLKIEGRSNDIGAVPQIEIRLNGKSVFQGISTYPQSAFASRVYDVGAFMTQGRNHLEITNLEPSGTLGMPPWFMVSKAELVPSR